MVSNEGRDTYHKRLSIRGLGSDFDVLCITSGLLFCSVMSMHGVLGASMLVIQDWCHLFFSFILL